MNSQLYYFCCFPLREAFSIVNIRKCHKSFELIVKAFVQQNEEVPLLVVFYGRKAFFVFSRFDLMNEEVQVADVCNRIL